MFYSLHIITAIPYKTKCCDQTGTAYDTRAPFTTGHNKSYIRAATCKASASLHYVSQRHALTSQAGYYIPAPFGFATNSWSGHVHLSDRSSTISHDHPLKTYAVTSAPPTCNAISGTPSTCIAFRYDSAHDSGMRCR